MNPTDRANRIPSRRAMTMAGIATIACSLIVSIGPAFAAPGSATNSDNNGNVGNGNPGTVKIHDATTALEAGLVGNEPWVCSFWVGFYAANGELGTWQLQSWPPTGDGTVVATGTYDTSGDGVDATSALAFADGHYRVEWQANGSGAKQKTFWVSCDESSNEGGAPSQAGTPSDEAIPSQNAVTPSQGALPSDEEDELGGGASDPPQQPEEDVKAGTSGDHGGSVDASNSGEGTGPGVPDTAVLTRIDTGLGGILAAIGVLLIVLAHASTRRERHLPSA